VACAYTESALQSRGGDGFFLGDHGGRDRQTVFPSTKFAVNVVCSAGPQGWG
jgi:hypothetical protein